MSMVKYMTCVVTKMQLSKLIYEHIYLTCLEMPRSHLSFSISFLP